MKSYRRTTDGRTDDGQRVITIVHLSLRLKCTKKAGEDGILLHRNGKFVIWKIFINGLKLIPSRSTGVDPGKKQKCYYLSCL